uniref:Uncharacterized protein n=1 Tax=Wuchereria bancrofti TaxID=6293 RepID=A0AAF5PIF2_WUCBA
MPSRTLFCRKCEGHGRQIVLKEMAFMIQEYGCSQTTISNICNASIPIYQQHEVSDGPIDNSVDLTSGKHSKSKLQNYISEQFNSNWQIQGRNSDLFLNQFENRCMSEFVAMLLNQCTNSLNQY